MKKHFVIVMAAAAFLFADAVLLAGCSGGNGKDGIEIIDLAGYEDGGTLTDRMLDSMAQEIRVIEL